MQIQKNYPLVSSAASEIRALTNGTKSIEDFLRDQYRNSLIPEDKRIFFEIPLYLQHLLFDISINYTHHPDNYNVLVTRLNRLKEVIYITLNYDLILDGALSAFYEISSLNSYINDRKNWSLIKLHGSVNWGYEANVPEGANESDFFRGVLIKLAEVLKENKKLVYRNEKSLIDIRFQGTPPRLYYPALSVPIGLADELVCPGEHQTFLINKLKGIKNINILLIGFSGFDSSVLNLLEVSQINLRSLMIVNGSLKSGWSVIEKLRQKIRFTPNNEMVYKSSFTNFVRDGSLDKFLNF